MATCNQSPTNTVLRTKARLLLIARSMSTTTPSLAQFLIESKTNYLKDVGAGKGKDWTLVMGNEAGGKCGVFLAADTPTQLFW